MDRLTEAARETHQAVQQTQLCHPAALPRQKRPWWPIAFLLALTVAVRIGGIDRPLVGHFATKNAIYGMIARNWAVGRTPFWLPMTDCLIGGHRGYHLLEIPVAAYLAGAGWALCGGSLDVWGRAVSIAFSAAAVVLLFLLVRHWHTGRAAWVAALVLALSPASIIYGQSFMLEASVIFFMLAALGCTDKWLSTPSVLWFLLATLSVMLLLCTKIYMLLMLLPLAVFAARKISSLPRKQQWRWLVGCLCMAILAAVPAIMWCLLTLQLASADHPESRHVYYSLYRSAGVHSTWSTLLLSSDFYLRMLSNIVGAGLTPVGLLLAVFGIGTTSARRHWPWLAAMAILVLALPGKFIELRYYTLVLVPSLAVVAGLGWDTLAARLPWPQCVAAVCLVIGVACSLRLSIGPAFVTPPEDRAVIAAASAVRAITSSEEPVVTLHGAGCDLLYYCDRPGWALSTNDRHLRDSLDQCRQQGAQWLVVADLSSLGRSTEAELAQLPLLIAEDDFGVYRLPTGDRELQSRTITTRR